ncbi:histidine phosphatase family protein [Corynebacterium flavescens]|uniref:Phosphoglycerate mutase n=1 Tax=Corynebacterium flavescens TaxID=28028 RepID=A0A1L7CPN0_CORFL|nr:histidine phosphatase family protein [Corynebacterium flavescens]APT87797.1 phosphoglycerate mutase [Corynebacterium flavescens]KAA8719806.1 histidine phosphatase family protein [Corynebacterium flavescens]GEB98571.1 phosphoglycerate mutase [Corynebacterium flavescens]
MSGRIILLRHGQTFSNIQRMLDTRPPGAELTERGRAQAQGVGKELTALTGDRPFKIYSSVALRAQQTAQLAARSWEQTRGLPAHDIAVSLLSGIHEVFAGDLEMSNSEDSHREYMVTLRGWLDGDAGARMPGGENYLDLLARYRPTLESVAHTLDAEEDAIIVSHGAAIRVATCHATGIDADFAFSGYMPNCRFTIMEPRGRDFGQWTLTRWADTEMDPGRAN